MIGNDWVPFHRRLAKGPKKALPRGVRFVLLELSLESRPTGGIIDLPVHWDTLKAVHDLIGGNRKEIKKALEEFQKPDELGIKSIQIERDETKHRLILTKWREWAGPKSSAERVAEHRERKKNAELVSHVTLQPVTPGNGCNALQKKTVENSTEEKRNGVTPLLPGLEPIEAEIRRHAIFASLDANAIARKQAERIAFGPQRPEWLVAAIAQCAEKSAGLGLTNEALLGKLVSFMHAAKKPREQAKPVVAVRGTDDDDKPPTDAELEANRKRMEERRAKVEAERERRAKLGQSLEVKR